MVKSKEIKRCEVCSSNKLVPVLDLGKHSLCDDLIAIGNKRENIKFPINILYCKQCCTAHQKFQVPRIKLFPKNYHYRSRFTADVLKGMDELVNSVSFKTKSLEGKVVLDVGCNDGSLLDKFRKRGAITIGVEPTQAYTEAEGRGHKIINDFFLEKTANKIIKSNPRIDIITFTNVFAHIENLPNLLKTVSILMNKESILLIENHYLGAILNHNQFDTFYHEHPRTYSLTSFLYIAKTLNCKIISVEFPKRYGGNIRVLMSKTGTLKSYNTSFIKSTSKKELSFLEKFSNMHSFINFWKIKKKKEILNLVNLYGKLPAKAFPGRAAILIEMLELSKNQIDCIYEKPGSAKIGHFVPGTKIPIKSDEELINNLPNVKIILNLAWHLPQEIEKYLKNYGFKGRLIDIMKV
jgi:SAM-dependent methyltransferase